MAERRTRVPEGTPRPVVVITLEKEAGGVVAQPEELQPIWKRHGPFAIVPTLFGRRHHLKLRRREQRHFVAVMPPGGNLGELAESLGGLPNVRNARLRVSAPDPGDVPFQRERATV